MDRILVIPLVLLLVAGCASAPTHDAKGLDTGDIPPSETQTLTFAHPGELEIHCHPHPWMQQNVTVTSDAPGEVHVHIVDGIDEDEYRFEPASITVGAGTRVVYHNHGDFTHTATQKTDDTIADAHA